MECKLSVVVPVYNVENYLEECVNSLINQTITALEIILVDDGSTDKSGYLCDKLAMRDSRIRVIHKKNGGLGSARNAGINVAVGEYIGFLDSDDYLEVDTYELLIKVCIEEKCQIACFDRFHVKENGTVEIMKENKNGLVVMSTQEAIKKLLLSDFMTYSACDKVFRRELFKELRFPEDKNPSEDIACIYQVLCLAEQIVHIGEAKYYYREVGTSITHKPFTEAGLGYVKWINYVYQDVCSRFPTLNEAALYQYVQALASTYVKVCEANHSKRYNSIKRKIEKMIKKQINAIIKNSYLNKNSKIEFILIVFRLDWIIQNIQNRRQ